jgi:Arc/MetJ-type ribon-helix-helix transcriptional regulator
MSSVELPEAVEEGIRRKVEKGEYSSISDFLREAARTHLDRVLLAPEDISERAREVRQEEVEGRSVEEVLK